MTKWNTADGFTMTALGMMVLQLRIVVFKLTHNFIICHRLPNMEILFGIDIQKKFSLSYAWYKEKNCYIQKDGRSLSYTGNCEQKETIGIVKSYHYWNHTSYRDDNRYRNLWTSNTKVISPRHNGIVPIKIKGHTAYFISNGDSTKGKDPNINIINGIHNI